MNFPMARLGKFGRSNGLPIVTIAARERQSIHPSVLPVHQGAETAGEVWRQSVRHLAPLNPPQIRAWSLCETLRDSRLWLPTAGSIISRRNFMGRLAKEQSFPALLNWWVQQNPKGRHLWPGLTPQRR